MADERSTRMEIIDAAYTVLVEHGYDGFTTRAVADEAGRNQSLVHYYFETKRDLLLALVEEALSDLAEQLEQLSHHEPADRLLALTQYIVETPSDDDLAFKRLMLEFTAQAPYDDHLRAELASGRQLVREYIVETVQEGIESGQFRAVDPATFTATYQMAMSGTQAHTAVFADETDELVVAGLSTLITEYLIEGEE